MRADILIQTQRLIAQSIFAMAEHIANSTGYALTPVTFAELPAPPAVGMLACVTDSTVVTWGGVIAGGGSNKVLAWYNGSEWRVAGI